MVVCGSEMIVRSEESKVEDERERACLIRQLPAGSRRSKLSFNPWYNTKTSITARYVWQLIAKESLTIAIYTNKKETLKLVVSDARTHRLSTQT